MLRLLKQNYRKTDYEYLLRSLELAIDGMPCPNDLVDCADCVCKYACDDLQSLKNHVKVVCDIERQKRV